MDLSRAVYSRDLKLAAMRALDSGATGGEIARKYKVSPKLLERWRSEWRAKGEHAFPGIGRRGEAESSVLVGGPHAAHSLKAGDLAGQLLDRRLVRIEPVERARAVVHHEARLALRVELAEPHVGPDLPARGQNAVIRDDVAAIPGSIA